MHVKNIKRFGMIAPPDLLKKARIIAVENGTTLSDLVRDNLKEIVTKHENGKVVAK